MNAFAVAVLLAAGSDLLEPLPPPEPASEQIPRGKSLELSGGVSLGRMEVARPRGGTFFLSLRPIDLRFHVPVHERVELGVMASFGMMIGFGPFGYQTDVAASARLTVLPVGKDGLFKIALLAGVATQYGNESLFCDPACAGFLSTHAAGGGLGALEFQLFKGRSFVAIGVAGRIMPLDDATDRNVGWLMGELTARIGGTFSLQLRPLRNPFAPELRLTLIPAGIRPVPSEGTT